MLVVDDTAYNIIPVRGMLKDKFDLDIEKAENGAIALQKYQEALNKPCGCVLRTFRLIIMDLGMPVMSGEEASEKILKLEREVRKEGNDELTHIVALTSFTNKKVHDNCRSIGIKEVYLKPLTFAKLQ